MGNGTPKPGRKRANSGATIDDDLLAACSWRSWPHQAKHADSKE